MSTSLHRSRKLEGLYSSRFFVRHKTYLAFLFVIISLIAFFSLYSSPDNEKEAHIVSSGSVKHYIQATGQVEVARDANLLFQTDGEVAFVGVKKGDAVTEGKVLATLSAGSIQTLALQAEDVLSDSYALLTKLRQGPPKEEIAHKEDVLKNTKNSLSEFYGVLPDVIQTVDVTTADIVKNKFSALFIPGGETFRLSFSSCDQRLQRDIEIKRTNLETVLADFQKKSSMITPISSKEVIDATFEEGYTSVLLTNDLVSSLVDLLLLPCSLASTSLTKYHATLSEVTASMSALVSDLTYKRSALTVSKNIVNQVTQDLKRIQVETDQATIESKRKKVVQAEEQMSQVKSALNKTIMRAPFDGVINEVTISVDEVVGSDKVAIRMFPAAGFEVSITLSESDSKKIKTGASVDVTLDAQGTPKTFPAVVTYVEQVQDTKRTTPSYKAVITFLRNDERIKQGMKANMRILAEEKSNIIVLPARFIRVLNPTEGEVLVLEGARSVKRTVTLGLRDAKGEFEITSGLLEGDKVLPLSY